MYVREIRLLRASLGIQMLPLPSADGDHSVDASICYERKNIHTLREIAKIQQKLKSFEHNGGMVLQTQ
jgi:hypothetical protein